jgi:predicted permease
MTAAFPVEFHTYLDLGSVAFAVGLGVFAALVFGLPPALVLAGRELFSAIRPDARAAGGRGIRSALMGAQIAFAMLVLVAAAMFWDGFARSRETSPGFQTGGVVLAAYDLTGHPDGTGRGRTAAFARRLIAGLAARPGIDAVSIAASVPLDIHGLPRTSFTIDGARREDGRDEESVSNVVTPGYFATLGIRIVQGMDFASLEDATAPPQVVVNDAFVERYLPGVLPIGHRLQSGGRAYTIVGVVATTVSDAFGEPPTPAIYFSYRDRPRATGEVHLRTAAGADAAARAAMREVVRGIDPDLPLYNVRTMDEHIDRNLVLRKVPARMFLVLGPLLLALAAIGIHAVVDRAVAERRSEIGLRMALGAEPGRVVRGVMGDSLRPVSIGAGFGWSLAMLLAWHLAPGGHVPWRVLLGVPAGLTAVAMMACWIPARRAASIPPAVVIRDE